MQQDLSQLLKVALEDGADPTGEPKAFRVALAKAGQARGFEALKAKLARDRDEAHRAYEAVVAAPKGRP